MLSVFAPGPNFIQQHRLIAEIDAGMFYNQSPMTRATNVRHRNVSVHWREPSLDMDGNAMMALVEELFPICRSITGNGVRRTLEILRRYIPLEVNEVPSGTPVLDWTVPREWNIRDAYVTRQDGTRVVDFAAS